MSLLLYLWSCNLMSSVCSGVIRFLMVMHAKTFSIIILNIHSIYSLCLTFGFIFFQSAPHGVGWAIQQVSGWRNVWKALAPKPVYFVSSSSRVDMRVVEFYPTKEHLHISVEWIALSSHVCKDRVSSMNRAAVRAIRFMECRKHKVHVDFNYEQKK